MNSTATLTRLFDGYRRTAASRTAIALVVANAIPLVGVLFFGWSLWTILVLYWIENGIVGLWNVPKILLARGSVLGGVAGGTFTGTLGGVAGGTSITGSLGGAMPELGRVGVAAFFILHYGIFWLVHGVFVLVLPTFFNGFGGNHGFGSPVLGDFGAIDPATGLPIVGYVQSTGGFGDIVWSSVAIGAVAMLISHGVSFFANYLGRGEYLNRSPLMQMGAPYGRVVVLHVTILFGAFAIAFLGAPILLLLVLVVAKTLFDLSLHLREHEPRSGSAAPASA